MQQIGVTTTVPGEFEFWITRPPANTFRDQLIVTPDNDAANAVCADAASRRDTPMAILVQTEFTDAISSLAARMTRFPMHHV
jgi:hypothetical protein